MRFTNALVRHPVLSQEQLVVMFLTVPTVIPRPLPIRIQVLTGAGIIGVAETSDDLGAG